MAVALQLTTDKLLVNLDYSGNIVDLCWPNKADDNIFLRGQQTEIIYCNGENIKFTPELIPVIHGSLEHMYSFSDRTNNLNISLIPQVKEDTLLKTYHFQNSATTENTIDLFVHSLPDFGANYSRDTAAYLPEINGIVHYEADKYWAVSANLKPTQYACQAPEDFAGRGAKPSPELKLSNNPITLGKLDTSLHYSLKIPANSTVALKLYFQSAHSLSEVCALINAAKEKEILSIQTSNLAKTTEHTDKFAQLLGLDTSAAVKFKQLLLTSQRIVSGSYTIHGGSFAGVDSSYLKTGGVDDYAYFWPRDGALNLLADLNSKLKPQPLQTESAKYRNYFAYLAKCFGANPYLYIRYRLNERADLASHWHAWVDSQGNSRLPLQLDETALSIFVYAKFLRKSQQTVPELQAKLTTVARFLLDNIDEHGVHQPCIEPWENHWGIFTSTQISLIAALKELGYIFATYFTETAELKLLKHELELTTEIALKALETEFVENGRFIRGKLQQPDGSLVATTTADSLIHWAWYLEVLEPTHPILVSTINYAAEKLKVNNGFARFEGDHYLTQNPNYPGNPWYISTLWFCRYYILTTQYAPAQSALNFVLAHMESTGLLPEMAHPDTGFALSIKPLVWSHAEVLNLLN